MKRVHESNAPTWGDMAELFQELEYFPAEINDTERLCCYLEVPTSIPNVPVVTILANYYPNSQFTVSVVSSDFVHGVADDGEVADAYSRTGLDMATMRLTSERDARMMLMRAERAASLYVQALKTLYSK